MRPAAPTAYDRRDVSAIVESMVTSETLAALTAAASGIRAGLLHNQGHLLPTPGERDEAVDTVACRPTKPRSVVHLPGESALARNRPYDAV
jgi:hypothetical protein